MSFVMIAVLTAPAGPSGLAGRPLIENANAPASPTTITAFSRTSCFSLSPACIRRATVTLPSAVILTQQSAVVASSMVNALSTPCGRVAPLVATGAGAGVALGGVVACPEGVLAAAGGGDGGLLVSEAGIRTRIVK